MKDPNKLTKRQELILSYYISHPGCTRKECAQSLFGNSDIFSLRSLESSETALRKKGYVIYCTGINGEMIDMRDPEVDNIKTLK